MNGKELFRPMAIATGMGVVAVLITWAIAVGLEVDFTVSNLGMPIPVAAFAIFSIVGGIGAWAVSSILVFTKKPRANGQIIGWLVLVGSIATPLSSTTNLAAIFWIQATHFAIGIPLLVAMFKHLPATK